MLVFLDESGDTGFDVKSGASRFFTVSIVIFNDHDEATRLDQRINDLRRELHLSEEYEFHFANNSTKTRQAFLTAVAPFVFSYITVAIDKTAATFDVADFRSQAAFYKYACNMVLMNALPYLDKATLIIDKSGSKTFQGELRSYLRDKMNDRDGSKIKRYKTQDSAKNNLVQLVDYFVGICSRKIQGKKGSQAYYKMISSKEIIFQKLPK